MRYVVRKSIIKILGTIWLPPIQAALELTLSDNDVNNIRDRVELGITRRNVESWLDCNAGDFQSVEDFMASLEDGTETIEIPWSSDEAMIAYTSCMYPAENAT